MSYPKIKHNPNTPVFRNTWKNKAGYIRTCIYQTRERAECSARNAKENLYQEIASPVWPEQCFLTVENLPT